MEDMQVSDDEARDNIAANVARLRGDRSKYWLAKQAGTHTINITRIENGDHAPGPGLLTRLAEALGVSVDTLLRKPNRTRRAI
jgi:transcriptional regulator with XRE-family HTH domain